MSILPLFLTLKAYAKVIFLQEIKKVIEENLSGFFYNGPWWAFCLLGSEIISWQSNAVVKKYDFGDIGSLQGLDAHTFLFGVWKRRLMTKGLDSIL